MYTHAVIMNHTILRSRRYWKKRNGKRDLEEGEQRERSEEESEGRERYWEEEREERERNLRSQQVRENLLISLLQESVDLNESDIIALNQDTRQ